jgi:hypothetical protein
VALTQTQLATVVADRTGLSKADVVLEQLGKRGERGGDHDRCQAGECRRSGAAARRGESGPPNAAQGAPSARWLAVNRYGSWGSSLGHRALVLAGTAVAALLIAAMPSQATVLPVHYNGLVGYAHISSTASPPGSNNWRCRPSREHPRPVILVHGTFADMSDSWQALSPLLYDNGYCVFALKLRLP